MDEIQENNEANEIRDLHTLQLLYLSNNNWRSFQLASTAITPSGVTLGICVLPMDVHLSINSQPKMGTTNSVATELPT